VYEKLQSWIRFRKVHGIEKIDGRQTEECPSAFCNTTMFVKREPFGAVRPADD
jgi:hypothetical protein